MITCFAFIDTVILNICDTLKLYLLSISCNCLSRYNFVNFFWQSWRNKCQKAFPEMHLFKCFVKFFKGSYKICLSIYHFEIMKIQKVCISNLSKVAAINLSQQLSGLDFCNKNFVLFVEKIMGQIQLNTSNGINIIAIIWVLQPKWINPCSFNKLCLL